MTRKAESADTSFACALITASRRIKSANRTLARLLGESEPKLQGTDISAYLPEVSNFEFCHDYERQEVNKEGWNHNILELVRLEEKPELYLLLLKDLTYELSQIVSEHSLYSRMINAISDGIHITDGNGTVLYFNDAFMELSGIKRDETMNKNLYDMVDQLVPYVASQSISLLVLETKQPQTIMVEYNRTKKKCLVTGTPVFLNGDIVRVVSISRDITELNLLRDKVAAAHSLNITYKQKLKEMEAKTENPIITNAKSKAMRDVFDTALKVAPIDIPVLILGETGVGKDHLAKFIHEASDRNQGHFIKLNCGAIPEQLLESELFGYESGAFTGASKQGKAGQFELANGGTLFLDEIGEMPQNMQVKLLSAIQDKRITRVGGTRSFNIDARIIAATNVDLPQRVAEGAFRQDLYFRLNVIEINIPPLRQRQEDILTLATVFLDELNRKHRKTCYFSPPTMELLYRYHWPGNIREMKNTIERVVILSDSDYIPAEMFAANILTSKGSDRNVLSDSKLALKERVREYEALIIQEAISKHHSLTRAAEVLGIDFSTLVRKRRRYNLQ